MLTSIKFRVHALSCGTIDWPKILPDDHTRAMYNKHLLMLMTGPTQCDDHQELILQAVGVYKVMVCRWTDQILARNPLLEVEADLS
jgi:hypothetical protein